MATTISTQDIVDAKRDIDDIGKAVNEKVIVSPRYGEDFKSIPMISAEGQAAISTFESNGQSSINSFDATAQNTINNWESAIALITQEGGVPALAVSDASGVTQQDINDLTGAPYRVKAGGYDLNARVMLDNGDIVRSNVAGNTVDPNVDMTGWILVGGEWIDITSLLLSGDEAATWNTTVFKNAIDKAKSEKKGIRVAPRGEVAVNDHLDFSGIRNIELKLSIKNPIHTVTFGGEASTGALFDVYVDSVHNGTSVLTGAIPTIPTIKISGVKGGKIEVGNTNLLNIHAVGGDTAKGSNAYFDMFIGGVIRAFRVSDEGTLGWNTRINVRGGRIIDLDVTGTGYVPNELLFDSNTFEGNNFKMRFDNAASNRVTNARFEGTESSAGIIFTSTARANTVVQRWSGSGSNRNQFKPYPPISDSGSGNLVTTNSLTEFNKINLFTVGLNSEIIANNSDSSSPDPRICRTSATHSIKQVLKPNLNSIDFGPGRLIALSNMVPVQKGDVVNFDCKFAGSLLRPRIFIYDENKKAITSGTNHISLINGVFFPKNGSYSVVADLSAEALSYGFDIVSSDVKYIEVGVFGSASGSFQHLSCNLFTQKYKRSFSDDAAIALDNLPTLNGSPSYGLPSIGRKIFDSSQNRILTCTSVLRTRATAASNSTSPALASYAGLAAGMIFGCIQIDGTTKWTTITAFTGSSITLAEAVNVDVNSYCVSVRWEALNLQSSSVTKSYTPPSIAAGSSVSETVLFSGVAVGVPVAAAFSEYNANIEITAAASSANVVTVKLKNTDAAPVALSSGTLTVKLV